MACVRAFSPQSGIIFFLTPGQRLPPINGQNGNTVSQGSESFINSLQAVACEIHEAGRPGAAGPRVVGFAVSARVCVAKITCHGSHALFKQ